MIAVGGTGIYQHTPAGRTSELFLFSIHVKKKVTSFT